MSSGPAVLVVAKAPVPGRVKTRLARAVGTECAARLAAAALLDTMSACVAAFGTARCHLALHGDLGASVAADELIRSARGWTVHAQLGTTFAARLVDAHHRVAAMAGGPVLQVGMDTPQLRAEHLLDAARHLTHPDAAVLGPAEDGGWWLLGVGGTHLLAHLEGVAMSTRHTGSQTRRALIRAGAHVGDTVRLRDVDEAEDAQVVAAAAPRTRFAAAWAARP